MAAARHIVQTQSSKFDNEMIFSLLQPRFELNPKHPIIIKLSSLTSSNPELASLLIKQVISVGGRNLVGSHVSLTEKKI